MVVVELVVRAIGPCECGPARGMLYTDGASTDMQILMQMSWPMRAADEFSRPHWLHPPPAVSPATSTKKTIDLIDLWPDC